jgi:4-hydroxybenzoate polyprenyltransferase
VANHAAGNIYINKAKSKASKVLSLVTYTRVYVAAGSALIVYTLSLLSAFQFSPLLGTAVFGAVAAVYAMNRKSDIEEDEANIEAGGEQLAQRTYYAGLIALVVSLLAAALTGPYTLVAVTAFIAAISAYSFKLLPSGLRYQRLKEIPFVKNIVVAMSLAFLWVSGSFANLSAETLPLVLGLLSFLSLRVLIGAIIPDIRDIEGDEKAGVRTIPVIFGVDWTKKLLIVANVAATLIYSWMLFTGILPQEAVLAGAVNLFSFPLIVKTTEHNADTATLITESNTMFTFSVLLLAGFLL